MLCHFNSVGWYKFSRILSGDVVPISNPNVTTDVGSIEFRHNLCAIYPVDLFLRQILQFKGMSIAD